MRPEPLRLICLVLLFTLMAPMRVYSQQYGTGGVSGHVTDRFGKKGVAGVTITATLNATDEYETSAQSQDEGKYSFPQLLYGLTNLYVCTQIRGTYFSAATSVDVTSSQSVKPPSDEPLPLIPLTRPCEETSAILPARHPSDKLANRGPDVPNRVVNLSVLAAYVPTAVISPQAQSKFEKVIEGHALSSKNLPISDARLSVINAANGKTVKETPTERDGHYKVILDNPGEYFFLFTAIGYRPARFLVSVDEFGPPKFTKVDSNLEPPEIGLVSVGDEILTRKDDTMRRQVFLPREMETLPLPGFRSFDRFALLAPGILPPPETSTNPGPGVAPGIGTAGQFSANGLRSRENNFNIDGSDNNDEDVGTRRQGYVSLTPQPVESLQEFQVITALADARFGRSTGAQVNALSKSGGQKFHGSLYEYVTDKRLNARDFFDQTVTKNTSAFTLTRESDAVPVLLDGQALTLRNPSADENPYFRSQFGINLEGPLSLLKSFFFVSFERQTNHASREEHFAVPTVKQRGLFESGETGLKVGTTTLSPASLSGNAIFSLYPFPNNPLGPYGKNDYTEVLPASATATQLAALLRSQFGSHASGEKRKPWDYFSGGDLLTGRFNFTDEARTLPDVNGAIYSSLRPIVRTYNLAFLYNRILSSKVADTLRVSFGRTQLSFQEARDPNLLPSSTLPGTRFLLNAPLLLNTTVPDPSGRPGPTTYVSASSPEGANILRQLGYNSVTQTEQITGPLGQVMIAGFSPVGVDVYNFPQTRANNTVQLAETLTYTRGNHTLTSGYEFRKGFINSTVDRNFRPLAVFGGLLNTQALPVTQPDGDAVSQQVLTGATLAAAGVPTGLFQSLATNPSSRIILSYGQHIFFIHDEWRRSSRLLLTLGMRFEANRIPESNTGSFEKSFDQQVLIQDAASACSSADQAGRCQDLTGALAAAFPANFRTLFGGDRAGFDPRAGFAWSATKDSRTVVRGGFGVYTGLVLGTVLGQSRNVFPDFLPLNLANFSPRVGTRTFLFNLANPAVRALDPNHPLEVIIPGTLNTTPTINPISLLANRLFDLQSISLSPTILGLDIVLPQKKIKNPYSMQYALSVERQLLGNYLVAVSFVGTRGIKLPRVSTPALGLNRSKIDFAGIAPLSQLAPFPVLTGSELPPQSSVISKSFTIAPTVFESSASSTYNSLQVEVRKRYNRYFQFESSLTYSHTIDDASDFFDLAGAFAIPQDNITRSERASANFDTRLRATFNFIWDIPFFKDSRALGGWQVAGIFTTQSGQPYTVNSTIDVNRDGNLTDRLNSTNGLIYNPVRGDGRIQIGIAPSIDPRSLLAPDGADGSVGRNTFRAPRTSNFDISFIKNFAFTPTPKASQAGRSDYTYLKFSFRVEIFNLFNQAQFGIPVRILESPAFGSSVRTTVPGRVIQFAFKTSF
jgi:hypothetical protein